MADIVVDMISDLVNLEIESMPGKNVLMQNGIVAMAPQEIASALRNSKGAGDHIQMPAFVVESSDWEAAKLTGSDYTARTLSMVDEYGIVVHRRKLFNWDTIDDMRRVWGANAEKEIARQLAGTVAKVYNKTLQAVLEGALGALASTNQLDCTALSGDTTLSPNNIVTASALLGDIADDLSILVCHSKPWADLKKLGYGTYASAILMDKNPKAGQSLWVAGDKIVWVTDLCGSPTAGKYYSYLLAPNQLSITPMSAFSMIVDPKKATNETRAARGDLDFIPHLTGVEYKVGSTENPGDSDLKTTSNFQLGRFASEKEVRAVQLITE